MDWNSIIDEWRGSISMEAIAEAVRLAREIFQNFNTEFLAEQT